MNGVEGAEKGGKSTCVQLVATIPPLRSWGSRGANPSYSGRDDEARRLVRWIVGAHPLHGTKAQSMGTLKVNCLCGRIEREPKRKPAP